MYTNQTRPTDPLEHHTSVNLECHINVRKSFENLFRTTTLAMNLTPTGCPWPDLLQDSGVPGSMSQRAVHYHISWLSTSLDDFFRSSAQLRHISQMNFLQAKGL